MKTGFSILFMIFCCITLNAQQDFNVADSNNLVAIKLYHEVNKAENENIFFSPFSINTAMAMVYAGAKNETEKQMCHTLHFTGDQDLLHSSYKTYLGKIESDTGKDLTLGIANSMWIANSIDLLKPFSEIMSADYKTEAFNVSFSTPVGLESTRLQINYWVEQKTHKKIKDLIQPGILNISTKLMLVDAIYFKGKWKTKFSIDSTKMGEFYTDNSGSVNADYMHATSHCKYYADSILQAVDVPYSDGKVSMLILLPREKNGIGKLEKTFDFTYYSKIAASLHPERIRLAIPKFKTTQTFLLSDVLSEMGMPIAFSQTSADFTNMSNDALSIGNVVHKAFIEVNEEGTEAAAATAVSIRISMVPPPSKTYSFIASHPFIFVIRDNATGGILFMGRISNTVKE